MAQLIFPSIVAKNQKELDADLNHLKNTVKVLHLDIVDGKFAPNHSLNFKFKLSSKFKYNAHLMIKHPEAWIKTHWKKIELFIPQFEELKDFERYYHWMKQTQRKVAVAIKPETKVNQIKSFLKHIDYVLVLTVHPGFYGSKFLPKQLKKITQIKKLAPKVKVIVDGGMNPDTIKLAVRAGADYFVSGSYTTKAEKPKEAVNKLTKSITTV
jgi:ribulose-phosphate 3-epimerase